MYLSSVERECWIVARHVEVTDCELKYSLRDASIVSYFMVVYTLVLILLLHHRQPASRHLGSNIARFVSEFTGMGKLNKLAAFVHLGLRVSLGVIFIKEKPWKLVLWKNACDHDMASNNKRMKITKLRSIND